MNVLREGANCSSIKKVNRLGMLVDANEYYRAFFDVANQANKSIQIVGWDCDSRIHMKHINRYFPDNLRTYFENLVDENKLLDVNIVSWKSPFYLRFNREPFASFKWKFRTSSHIHFHQARHPYLYGTFHEKMAVIDGKCAFIGGMDITSRRWDTSEHRPNNPLRTDDTGKPYHSIHDIQFVCSGEVVKDLNQYIHQRNLVDIEGDESSASPWPNELVHLVKNVEVGISQTEAANNSFEIETLYLDAIKSAKDYIYIENQYFTHEKIVRALCERLKDAQGPEIILVLPFSYRGLFEKAVYIDGRNRALNKLRKADKFGRLGAYYPGTSRLNDPKFIVVHSKLLIVDGTLMTLGSANLNHRSMRVDNELNLTLEAQDGDEKVERFIARSLSRLLSEHLDIQKEEFLQSFKSKKSLLKTITSFEGRRRKTLRPLRNVTPSLKEELMLLLRPMVDIRYPLPKSHFVIILFTLFVMSLVFMQEAP